MKSLLFLQRQEGVRPNQGGLCGVARRGCGRARMWRIHIRKAGAGREIAVIWSEGGIGGRSVRGSRPGRGVQ